LLEACNRAVEGSWPQPCTTQGCYVLDHCVAVLRSTGQARQYQYWRVGIVAQLIIRCIYYVSRTTHYVVIAYSIASCKARQIEQLRAICTLYEAVHPVHLIYHDQNAQVSPSIFERRVSTRIFPHCYSTDFASSPAAPWLDEFSAWHPRSITDGKL
jgi:hypothetical protein